jgi:hypothetical protein
VTPPSTPDPRDPRFRRFRAVALGFHLLVATVFSLLVTISVVRSVGEMTPSRPPAPERLDTLGECLAQIQGLWVELDDKRRALSAHAPAQEADDQWFAFRSTWLLKLRQSEARCGVGSRSRVELAQIYWRLERLLDLYTTHAVQFAGEIGGAVDSFRSSLEVARQDPAAGRFEAPKN